MRHFSFLLIVVLAGCSDPLPVAGFRDTAPALDPVHFFTGHVRSWGVLEDRSGQPTSIVTTECSGVTEHRVEERRVVQVTGDPDIGDRHHSQARVLHVRLEVGGDDLLDPPGEAPRASGIGHQGLLF